MFNKKILCLGNNSQDTNMQTEILAKKNKTINNGLISNQDCQIEKFGYYHTSILDLPYGEIISISKFFNLIIFLDQPKETWSHSKPLLSSFKLMNELDKLGYQTQYKNNKNIKEYQIFFEQIEKNKSFCIYPWINLVEEDGYLQTCSRARGNITTFEKLQDWKTDPSFTEIRNKMLQGTLLPDNCKYCYEYEEKNIESYRQFDTKDWLAHLDITSFDDLNKIDRPYYYEIRLSNKCNIMCRTCKPEHSHLIDREYKKFNIIYPPHIQQYKYSKLDRIDIEKLNPKVKVYLTGGEPTIISDVYRFMEKCIEAKKTDFDFTLGTNAVKLSDKFINLAKHFSNMNFSVSIDGYGKINDYIRWGSNWEKIISNTKLLESHNHNISINCVPGIFNVTNLHLLYEFLDKEFPKAGMYLQVNHVGFQSAYNHPNAELVLASLERCKNTNMYFTDGKSNKSTIDSLHDYYSKKNTFDRQLLKEFFDYNDKLDYARNSKLGDYIPELEECRKYIQGV